VSVTDPTAPTPRTVDGHHRAHVPWGFDLAAGWAWRFLVIVFAAYLILRTLGFFAVVTLPLVIALLVTSLVVPLVRALHRVGLPRGAAAGLVVVGGLVIVGGLLTFVGQQVANGANDLATSVADGLGQIKDWLKTGPLHASDSQINKYIDQAQASLTDTAQRGEVLGRVTEVGATLGHVFAGFFIVLFSTYFFLADGERIWSWAVRIAPAAAREQVDSSGRVAWNSLTQFVRATVLVALADAIGIMIVAAILGVPFVAAIGVLVFLGAFVPMVGATVAGGVAILVALVDQGPFTALLMLAGVIAVQQVEGHVLQPFLMGRFVSVHPLGVIVAIACGVLTAGIAGALVAVPLAAAGNAVVQHLAGGPGPDPEAGAVGDDLDEDDSGPDDDWGPEDDSGPEDDGDG
jgi:predicted PurR-regulated permease PerM